MSILSSCLLDSLKSIKPAFQASLVADISYGSGCGCSGDCGQSCSGGCETGCSGDCGRSCYGDCS